MRKLYAPKDKAEFVLLVMKSKMSAAAICRKHRISESNYYSWRKTFVAAGIEALSCSPRRNGHQTKHKPQTGGKESTQQAEIIRIQKRLQILRAPNALSSLRMNRETKLALMELINDASLSKSIAVEAAGLPRSTFYRWQKSALSRNGLEERLRRSEYVKLSDRDWVKEGVFRVFHSPPSQHGFNRTTWKLNDLQRALEKTGLAVGKHAIRAVIAAAGYRWLKARKVLTSNDPEYRVKLDHIHRILGSLSKDEGFFSIDEYGPFAVKHRGGRQLVAPGKIATVPQWQGSKGVLIMTAALELSTNQITHFYSEKKNTGEMLKLLDILLEANRKLSRIYISWDAATWHASKRLYAQVASNNVMAQVTGSTIVELAPLPAGAQFLNVIESVFSGMARAVIHNSDYETKEDAKAAIDEHFRQRNQHFRENPGRAGKKIWGKERQLSVFSEANNCKDPAYR